MATPERHVRLDFRAHDELEHADRAVRSDLSSVAAKGRCLWVANDEFATVERPRPAEPDFAFGHKITQAIDAVLESIDERRRVRVEEI